MHPFHHHAKGTGKAKLRAMGGKTPHNAHDGDARIRKAISAHETHLHGGKHTNLSVLGKKSGGRLDKKGRHKHKGAPPLSMPPAMPDMASSGPPPSPTPVPPPGMSSGPMPQVGPMGLQKKGGRVHKFARGGRTYTEGESKAENLHKWAGYASKNSYAHGGRAYPLKRGGSDSGVGRLEKSHKGTKKS